MQEQGNEQPEAEGRQSVGRRGFLVAGIYGLASIIASSLGITSALYLFRGGRNKHGVAWADAGKIPALGTGDPKKISFERTRVDGWKVTTQKDTAWVIKNTDGSLTAFSPLCTHLGCAYQWQGKRSAFVCPCHGSSFSKSGEVLNGPANRPLDRYQVKREGARIWLGGIVRTHRSNT